MRPDIFKSGTTKYKHEDIEKLLNKENYEIFVVVDSKKVVGHAMCEIQNTRENNNMYPFKIYYLDDFCIDESARSKGYGQKLFDFVKERAKELGCYEITLNSWAGNEAAECFYKKMGLSPKVVTLEYILNK